MHIRKNMIEANEGFTCIKCKRGVDPHHGGSCRNHCPFCLFSLHVDADVPGDRASECKGIMKPVGFEDNPKKGSRIRHECIKCGAKVWNRTAPDDNYDLICELSRIPQ